MHKVHVRTKRPKILAEIETNMAKLYEKVPTGNERVTKSANVNPV